MSKKSRKKQIIAVTAAVVIDVLRRQERLLRKIMTDVTQLAAKFDAISDKLSKASGEIMGELANLKAVAGQLPADAEASLARLEAMAQRLDDIIPDAPPAPAPEPTPEPEPEPAPAPEVQPAEETAPA